MHTLRDLIARAYCWISQSAWFGGSTGLRKLAGPGVSLSSTDGGETFTDEATGEVIDRNEAARRIAPHITPRDQDLITRLWNSTPNRPEEMP